MLLKLGNGLQPLLNSTYDNIELLNQEIEHVAWLLKDAAEKTLPALLQNQRKEDGEMLLLVNCVFKAAL